MLTELEQLKKLSRAPQWLSEEGLATLQKGYLLPNETPISLYYRLAKTAASHVGKEFEPAFATILLKGWFSPSTPIAANFGAEHEADRGLPVSCYGVTPGNSIYSIYEKAKEIALLSKHGGGIGCGISDLLGPTSASIWASTYDQVFTNVSQGKTRRGSGAVYIDYSHPDLLDVLNAKDLLAGADKRIKLDCNIAVCFNDEDLERIFSAPTERDIQAMADIAKLRMTFGSPYIQFTDNAKRALPECYKANGLSFKHSNLCCLSGDTLVHTAKGDMAIAELCSKDVVIADGEKYVFNSSFELKGYAKELLIIELDNGSIIRCTANHRWPLANGTVALAYKLIEGQMLASGQTIANISSEKYDEAVPVYCTNVPTTGQFMLANCVLTGNSEIILHSDEEHTYVCVLSSLVLSRLMEFAKYTDNGIKFDVIAEINGEQWTTPMLAIAFLDAVCQEFIEKASKIKGMDCSVRSAVKGRALGLGVLGYHTLLQKLFIPFACKSAEELNIALFKSIRSDAEIATARLAGMFGEPEWCKGFNRRNTHLLALAPTMSNSVFCNGGSASIEPHKANLYSFEGAKGIFVRKNKELADFLATKGMDTDEIWQKIAEDQGSVRSLPLSEEAKAVFATGMEIDQFAILAQAADRQAYIDQGQSLNLFLPPDINARAFWELFKFAWTSGLKALYYVRSKSLLAKETTMVPSSEASIVRLKTRPTCKWCSLTKDLLNKHGIAYAEEVKAAGAVPEILFRGQQISYSQLKAMLEPEIAEPAPECSACEG